MKRNCRPCIWSSTTGTHAYDFFVQMLRRCYAERPQALRALDKERAADPECYAGNRLLGMLMYVKAFAGTLTGVREKLDYV